VTDRAPALQIGIVLGVVALGHLSLVPNVADLDGFYHIGHAASYLERSIFDTSLPWATRSVIGDIGGDLWWGFHMLLVPFSVLGVSAGLHVAGLLLTVLLGLTVFEVLRRHDVAGAGWWTAVFLLAVPNVFFRYLMVRPHVISLAAAVLLASALVRGRWWHVLLLSALVSWVHLSLFWMPPLLAIAYGVVRIPVTVFLGPDDPDTGVSIRRAVPAAFAGVALGWLLRPDALATASLLNVQLIQLFAQKATDQPLTFAAELSPIGPAELVRTSWSFAAAWTATLGVVGWAAARGRLARLGQARATFVVLSLVVSAAFLGLALVSARRALEQWVAFGALAMPFAWALARPAEDRSAVPGDSAVPAIPQRWPAQGPRIALAAFLLAHLVWGVQRHILNRDLVSFPTDTLRGVASYLAENSEPGEPVFHARWDNFGPLFARNRSNRYLGGMDPIFQYAHDPRSYWEFFFLSADLTTEWTCDAYPCAAGTATDTHQALLEHFGTRWVVVEPYRNPRFTLYLLNDPRYEVAFESENAALFEVLPE
jgi:hypothetical protein